MDGGYQRSGSGGPGTAEFPNTLRFTSGGNPPSGEWPWKGSTKHRDVSPSFPRAINFRGGGEDDNDSGESPLNNKGCTQLIVVVSAKLKNMLVKLDHFPQGSEWKSLKPPATVKQGSVLLNDSNETTQSSRKGCENCANFTTKNRPGWVWSLIPSWRGLGKNFTSWLIFQQCHASQCFDGFWVPNMSRRCLAYVEEPLETGA